MTTIEPAAPAIVRRPDRRGPRIGAKWADELAKRASAMWQAGSSARVIGDAIGRTRNAVMGKVHRMGLQRSHQAKPSQPTAIKAQQATRRYAQKKRAPWVGVAELKPEITPTAVGIIELERHHCRWPVSGEGAAMRYCGGDALNGFPYCLRHARLAYQPGRRG